MAEQNISVSFTFDSTALQNSLREMQSTVQRATDNGSMNANKMSDSFESMGKRIKNVAIGVGTAIGAFKLLNGALNMVKNSVGDAVTRIDTLNRFPKVLEAMGSTAEEAEKAMKKLSNGIDGLPTTLDDIAGTAQRMFTTFRDADKASESALALNNALLASGATTDQASRGTEQYLQILSKGKIEGDEWITLQETMGYALDKVAESFGFTGKTAQRDFYEALKSGDITVEQFNDRIIELNEGTEGFAEVAKTATGGIATSWQNVQTAVTRGVANIISSFDEWLESNGFGGIAGVFDTIKEKVSGTFAKIQEVVPLALDKFKEMYDAVADSKFFDGIKTFKDIATDTIDVVKDLWGEFKKTEGFEKTQELFDKMGDFFSWLTGEGELVGSILTGVAVAITAVAVAIGVATTATALWNAVLAVNPITWITVLIGGLIGVIVYLWKNWDEVSEKLAKSWEWIKTKASEIFGAIKTWISDKWEAVKTKTSEIWDGIKTYLSDKWQSIKNSISDTWDSVKEKTEEIWNGIVTFFKNWGIYIIGAIFGPIGLVTAFIIDNWDTIKNNAIIIFTAIGDWISEKWNWIKETFITVLTTITQWVSDKFNEIKTKISETFENVKLLVTGAWESIKTKFSEGITNTINNVKTFKDNFVDYMIELKDKAIGKAQELVEYIKSVPQKMADGLSEGKDALIKGAKTLANGMIEGIEWGINTMIKGVNEILGLLGSDAKLAEISLPKFDAYARGTGRGGHPTNSPAWVGDGGQRELVIFPNGQTFLSPAKDTLINMPKGTHVINGKDTKAMLNGIPAYKNGTDWVKGIGANIVEKTRKAYQNVKDWGSEIWDWMKDKVSIKNLLVNKLSDYGTGGLLGLPLDLFTGGIRKALDSAVDYIFNRKEEMQFYAGDIANLFGDAFTFTSGFGPRWGRMHRGFDFGAPMGTPIPAVTGGKVEFSGWGTKGSGYNGFGNAVGVRDSSGRLHIYGHNSKNLVSKGDKVTKGQIIGLVGSTGDSTGPHVHYEVRVNGKAIDITKEMLNNIPFIGGKGVEQWRSIAIQALKMTGQYTPANLNRLLYQMQTESGGNPRAINLWDSNAKKGTPSKGLMQIIDPTFKAYAHPQYNKNIYDPLSNILASIRYSLSRYGSLANAWKGKGYASGGIFKGTKEGSLIRMAENGGDEAVVPLSNKTRMKPFAHAVAKFMPDDEDKYGDITNHFHINSMVVREEADIKKIAKELAREQEIKERARGRR